MKAIQIIRPGEIRLVEMNKPTVQPDKVLLKVKYVGFCDSDADIFSGKNQMVKLPLILGHEIGAVIEATGYDVPDYIKPGLSCTVDPYMACGNCLSCRNGRPNACPNNQILGVHYNGAMCEFISLPWNKVIVDPRITPKDFTLVEPMSAGFHAVARAAVTDVDTVAVIGCGMNGIGAVIRSSSRGAKVIAIDTEYDKLDLARSLGANYTINFQSDPVHSYLLAVTHNYGPDVIIETVGTPASYQMAINEVAFTGRVVCTGYSKTEILFDTKHLVQKELDVRGACNATQEDFRAVMECLKWGKCPSDKLISGVYEAEQVKDALNQWTANQRKVSRILIQFK
jgi:threonine dehydrogenase-like Zn-dependent dehydrogenase